MRGESACVVSKLVCCLLSCLESWVLDGVWSPGESVWMVGFEVVLGVVLSWNTDDVIGDRHRHQFAFFQRMDAMERS